MKRFCQKKIKFWNCSVKILTALKFEFRLWMVWIIELLLWVRWKNTTQIDMHYSIYQWLPMTPNGENHLKIPFWLFDYLPCSWSRYLAPSLALAVLLNVPRALEMFPSLPPDLRCGRTIQSWSIAARVGQSNFSYQWVHLYLLHKLISVGSFPFPLLNFRTQAASSSVDYLSGFEQHHVLYHNEIKTINCALFA